MKKKAEDVAYRTGDGNLAGFYFTCLSYVLVVGSAVSFSLVGKGIVRVRMMMMMMFSDTLWGS